MRTIRCICIIITLLTSLMSHASKSSDLLLTLLLQGRCFEARELYDSIDKDSISPAAQTFYNYKNCYFNNNIEKAREYLNSFIDSYLDVIPLDQKFIFLNLLVELETETRDYLELENSYVKILNILDSPPFCNPEYSQWSEAQKKTINEYILLAKHNRNIVPQMRVSTLDSVPSIVKFSYDKTGSLINCSASLNKRNCQVTLDTGLGVPCLIKQHTADSLGLKKIDFQLDSLDFNGIPTAVYATMIDSLDIADKRLYNLLGVVLQETHDKKGKELPVNIILGLPVLKELDGIYINWGKQDISFMNEDEKSSNSDYIDIYILYNCLYSKLYLNNHPFIGMVDIGYVASPISIYEKYFKPIENDFTIDNNRHTRQIGTINHSYSSTVISLREVDVKLNCNSNTYKISNIDVELDTPITFGIKDGVIGLSFFKEISKSTYIDFQNMKININPLKF